MSTIFISHSSRDNQAAKELAERLVEQDHHSLFLDLDPEKGIVAGQSWERTLYRKLRACRAVIVLCTDHYLTSHWCFAEIALARMEGKHILALQVDPLSPDAKLPSILTEKQFIDLRANSEEGYERLWRGLDEMDLRGVSTDWDPKQSPYLGLNAYQEQHASVFFGRDDETRVGLELLDRGAPGLVMVLGASGSGKSSMVRAGMVPRLRRDTDRWLVVGPFRPRRDPFAELADSLVEAFRNYAHGEAGSSETLERIHRLRGARALSRPGSGAQGSAGDGGQAEGTADDQRLRRLLQQLEELRQSPPEAAGSRLLEFLDWSLDDLRRICRGQPPRPPADVTPADGLALVEVADHLRRASGHQEARVLLVVDQFEELLGREDAADDANRFLGLLRDALEAEHSPLMALGTMRSDFLGVFQRNRALLGIDFESLSVGPMSIEGMRRVIEEPAKLGALELQRGLADSLLQDTETPDALPLLSFTLSMLWKNRENDTLTVRQYRELDGLHGAVSREADAVLSSARKQGKEDDVRRAFVRMARLTEDGSYARRPVSWEREEIRNVRPILEDFEKRRLLVTRMAEGEEPTVEVAHEALFRSWAPLTSWLDDHRSELLLLAQLRREALAWEESEHDSSILWHGTRLQRAAELMRKGELGQSGTDRRTEERFVRAGLRQRQQQWLKRAGVAASVLAVIAGLLWFNSWTGHKRDAKNLVRTIVTASPAELPNLVDRELPRQRRWADSLLEAITDEEDAAARERLYAELLPDPDDPEATRQARLLASLALDPARWPPGSSIVDSLWAQAREASAADGSLLPVAAALARLDPKGQHWSGIAPAVAEALSVARVIDVAGWMELLRPVKEELSEPLASLFEENDPMAPDISPRIQMQRSQQRSVALDVLGKYQAGADILVRLALAAEPAEFRVLVPFLEQDREEAADLLRAVLKRGASGEKPAIPARRRARAATALIRLDAVQEAWSELRHSEDPTVSSWIILLLEQSGVDPQTLFERLRTEPDASIRQALILSLGEYERDQFSAAEAEALQDWLLEVYRDDPDPGVHAAADWTLRRSDLAATTQSLARLAEISQEFRTGKPMGDRRWYLLPDGTPMTVLPGPVTFAMGSPPDEARREDDETLHLRTIDRSFAIAASEVTVQQFREFTQSPEVRRSPVPLDHNYPERFAPEAESPQINVTWYQAAKYCRWRSERDGIPEDQMCFPRMEEIKEGMVLSPNLLDCTGYRLPTEAEWEYACRAGSTTSLSFGNAAELLPRYGRFLAVPAQTLPSRHLRPNLYGLFDMHGNVWEWLLNAQEPYPDAQSSSRHTDRAFARELRMIPPRVIRGHSYADTGTRSADRNGLQPGVANHTVGFRIARTERRQPNTGQ